MVLGLKMSKVEDASRPGFFVKLELENESDLDVEVPRDLLLLDGFTSDKFHIIKQCADGDVDVPYKGRFVKYKPGNEIVKAHSKISKVLDLSDAYNLDEVGDKYSISYSSPAIWYEVSCEGACVGETLEANVEILV